MGFLAVVLVVALVAAVSYMVGGGRHRRRRPRPVPRPGINGHRRDADVALLLYAGSDANSMITEQTPGGAGCDGPPAHGDAGEESGDCDPGADSADSDSADSDSADSDSYDSGDSDSGGGDSPD